MSGWTFEAAAAIVRERAGGLCEVCRGAYGSAVNTHHRQPRGSGGVAREGLAVNTPAALIRVCVSCHNRIESYREWGRRKGYLVPRPTDPATVPAYLRTANGTGWFLLVEEGRCYRWVDLDPNHSAISGALDLSPEPAREPEQFVTLGKLSSGPGFYRIA